MVEGKEGENEEFSFLSSLVEYSYKIYFFDAFGHCLFQGGAFTSYLRSC